MSSLPVRPFPVYGIDDDRAQSVTPLAVLRRRLDGRYPVDAFGGDPQLQDLVAPVLDAFVRVHVEGVEHVPEQGPALLVSNRGLGVAEPTALAVAVRRAVGRRLRVVGTPEVPLLRDALAKLGGLSEYPDDLGAALRAGHLAALPLGPTWLRTGAGTPPIRLLVAALGFPVVPVAVRAAGPLGLPVNGWRIRFGPAITVPAERGSADPLGAAELAEAARDGVAALLDA